MKLFSRVKSIIVLSVLVTGLSSCNNSKSNSKVASDGWVTSGSTINISLQSTGQNANEYMVYVFDSRGSLSGLSLCAHERSQCVADSNLLVGFTPSQSQDGKPIFASERTVALSEKMKIIVFSQATSGAWSEGTYEILKGSSGLYAASIENSPVSQQTNPAQQSVQQDIGSGLTDSENRIVQKTNEYRAAHGLPALLVDPILMANTRNWAQTAASRFLRNGHSNQNVAENAFYLVATPEAAVAGWYGSPPHFANMMNPNYSRIGVGVAYDTSGVPYWYQQFY